MRYCTEEGSSFPDREFKKVRDQWVHHPHGEKPHLAERADLKTPKELRELILREAEGRE